MKIRKGSILSPDGWESTESGICAVCGSKTTRRDSDGQWVDQACEEAFLKEKKGEAANYD